MRRSIFTLVRFLREDCMDRRYEVAREKSYLWVPLEVGLFGLEVVKGNAI